MHSMTLPAATAADRPPLPMRPAPHERDGRQPSPGGGRPHPQQGLALAGSVDDQIGPRGTGAIYQNADGAFEVLALIRDPERARALLNRDCAQWALIVKDVLRPGAEPFVVGSFWTDSDHLVREADAPAMQKAVVA